MSRATIPIIEAIRQRRLLAFAYKGVARVVEPHSYGRDRWQREILCGYQVEGAGQSGTAQGWRTFIVENIGDLRLDARSFEQPRAQYQRNDGAFQEILAQL